MATATAPTIEALAKEVAGLEAEIEALSAKRATEQANLQTFFHERVNLQQAIARGKEPTSKASVLNAKIQGAEAAIAGFDSLISQSQSRLDRTYPELRRLRGEEKYRSEMEAIDQLGNEAKAAVQRIATVLSTTAKEDLAKYEKARNQLLNLNRNLAGLGVFPIPPTTQRVQKVLGELDRTIAENLAPILKLWR